MPAQPKQFQNSSLERNARMYALLQAVPKPNIRTIKPNIEPILDRPKEFHVRKHLRITRNLYVYFRVDQNFQAEYLLFLEKSLFAP